MKYSTLGFTAAMCVALPPAPREQAPVRCSPHKLTAPCSTPRQSERFVHDYERGYAA